MHTPLKALILTATLSTTASVTAEPAGSGSWHSADALACYAQTNRLSRGGDPDTLNTAHCNRALEQGPHTRDHQSAMLHNRGLIEMAQGNPEEARASLEASADLATEIGPQHLALAQLAARQGDRQRAMELYAALAASDSRNPLIADNRALFERNLQRLGAETGLAVN